MKKFAKNQIFPLIVFVLGLALTLPLLPTTVSFEDSGEFVSAAATFGIPHPSGYPLYVLLAGMFAKLPIGTIPWRITLFSALCAAAALAVSFVVARRLATALMGKLALRHEAFIALIILQLAVTETWWSQAVYAKVYSLHALLMALVTYVLLRWIQEKEMRWLSWAFFLFGLALSNHLFLTLSVAPFFAAALFVGMPERRRFFWWRRPRPDAAKIALLAVMLLLGLTPYLLLLIRPLFGPSYAFGSHAGFSDFLSHVFRTGYQDVGADGWNKIGLISSMGGQYARELGPLVLVLAVYGIWKLRSGRLGAVAVWLGGIVLSYPLIVSFRSIGWSSEVEYIYRVYALPGMAATAVIAAVGAPLLLERARATGKTAVSALLLVCAAALPVVSASLAAPRVAAYTGDFTEKYARAVLEPLPQDAVLVINDEGIVTDTELFALAYLQMVERDRTDVTMISDTRITPFEVPKLPAGYGRFHLRFRRRMLLEAVLRDKRYAGRPIFTTFAPEASRVYVTGRTNGVVYGLDQEWNSAGSAAEVPLPSDDVLMNQYALRALATHLLYNQAAYLTEHNPQNSKAGLLMLLRAINLDPYPFSNDYEAFLAHRRSM